MKLTCFEFRQLIGAEPRARDTAVLRHRLECQSCAAHAGELEVLDAKLERALRLPVPENLAARVLFSVGRERRPWRAHWLAAAAVLFAVGIGFGLWWGQMLSQPLPQALVEHLYHEPELLIPASTVVPRDRLVAVLDRGGARLQDDVGDVSHAGLCLFRGRLVAHLVVQTPRGPVTVMLLPREKVQRPVLFSEGGFHGVLLPVEDGSIAILGNPEQSLEPVEQRFVNAVRWQI